jgi:hypothetical protein
MVVKVSKPEINVREKISELDKPSGTAGQAMLAAETPQEQFNLIGAGRRNMLINGDFSIWQRGTSGVTGYASSSWKYAADRWKFYTRGNTGVGSFTKSTTEIDGVSYDAAYFQLTTGNTAGAAFIAQFIEGVAARGKDITFSFWYEHISGEYPSLRIEGVGNNVLATVVDGWNTVTTKSNNTFGANGLYVGIGAPSANPCSFKFTHAQLELGKFATPFEHRSYGEELALCQRYYTSLYRPHLVGTIPDNANRAYFVGCQFPVEMRTTPTSSRTQTGSSGNFKIHNGYTGMVVTVVNTVRSKPLGFDMDVTLNGDLANFTPAISSYSSSYDTLFHFDAEL